MKNDEHASKKTRVVLVDDNLQLLNILNMYLKRNGCSLLLAQSGDEAAQLIDADISPSLLLTDAVMPGDIQGPELALLYKCRWPNLPSSVAQFVDRSLYRFRIKLILDGFCVRGQLPSCDLIPADRRHEPYAQYQRLLCGWGGCGSLLDRRSCVRRMQPIWEPVRPLS